MLYHMMCVESMKIWSCKGIIVSQVHRKAAKGLFCQDSKFSPRGHSRERVNSSSSRVCMVICHCSPIFSDILMYYTSLVGEPDATMSVTLNMLLHPVQASFIIFLPP